MLGVGVDRLDYTKGIEQKFLAVERLLERRPDLVGRFVFVQLAEPSRECAAGVPSDAAAGAWRRRRAINSRFGVGAAGPIG